MSVEYRRYREKRFTRAKPGKKTQYADIVQSFVVFLHERSPSKMEEKRPRNTAGGPCCFCDEGKARVNKNKNVRGITRVFCVSTINRLGDNAGVLCLCY